MKILITGETGFVGTQLTARLIEDGNEVTILTRSPKGSKGTSPGISLIHSKPYDSPSRGKIERFFRTVRERFLSILQEGLTLEDLNEAFSLWLKDDYHHKLHSGIGERPIDRYNASMGRVLIRRLSRAKLDEIFLTRHERVVNHDATISFKGALYEVPTGWPMVDLRKIGWRSSMFVRSGLAD
jgi:hypothetical protein